MEDIKKKIQEWWDSFPCCSKIANSSPGTKEFYQQVDAYKDIYEPFTNKIADYASWKNKRVLEIGCGLGKDFSRFVSAGAKATAIDMSNRSLELTAKRLEIFGLKGNLCLADAESLPFRDNALDFIFSWGVIHHTPETQKAADNIYRCLRPNGGKITVMLYNKNSLNHLIFMMVSSSWFDLLRKLKKFLFRRNKTQNSQLGRRRLGKDQLLAAYTDGPGNPLSKVYSRREAMSMFSRFKNININCHEPKSGKRAGIFNLFRVLERRFGWFMVIEAEK